MRRPCTAAAATQLLKLTLGIATQRMQLHMLSCVFAGLCLMQIGNQDAPGGPGCPDAGRAQLQPPPSCQS